MRTSPYNIDLRKKVIEYIESGNSQKSAVKTFMLNESTVNRWWLRYKREGSYAARIRIGKKPRLKEEDLKEYIVRNPGFNTNHMGEHFNMTGSGAHYWLKKLGYTYKKKPFPTWKQTLKSEKNI